MICCSSGAAIVRSGRVGASSACRPRASASRRCCRLLTASRRTSSVAAAGQRRRQAGELRVEPADLGVHGRAVGRRPPRRSQSSSERPVERRRRGRRAVARWRPRGPGLPRPRRRAGPRVCSGRYSSREGDSSSTHTGTRACGHAARLLTIRRAPTARRSATARSASTRRRCRGRAAEPPPSVHPRVRLPRGRQPVVGGLPERRRRRYAAAGAGTWSHSRSGRAPGASRGPTRPACVVWFHTISPR